MVRFGMGAWFLGSQAVLAWFGVAEMVTLTCIDLAVNNLYVQWQGRFGDLLGDAKTRGKDALPEIYNEMWVIAYLSAYWVVAQPMNIFFRRWYSLRCDQHIQRAYIAQWPEMVMPEGTGQRLHEDIGWAIKASESGSMAAGGLRECWMWILDRGVYTIGQVIIFWPQLLALQSKFKAPSWFPGSEPVTRNWTVYLVIGLPLINTMISLLITWSMAGINYNIQRLDAAFRKVLNKAEDVFGSPVVETLMRDIMEQCVKLWGVAAFYGGWQGAYREAPNIAFLVITIPQIFSTEKGAPSLGDYNKFMSIITRLISSFSVVANQMKELAFFKSVLDRLTEFEKQTGYDKKPFIAPCGEAGKSSELL